jgi:serine/threonine protein kinase
MQPGQLLDNRYEIKRPLAAGGFGQTYLAIDTKLPSKEQVVVKLLKPSINVPLHIAQRLFDNEATILEQLGKNNDRIPTLYAHFESGGEFYLVQEFIEGMTLTDELKNRQLSESDTLEILKEILTGLKTVHDRDMIHRDLKPDNIIRRASDGKLVLIDFGAVKEIRVITGPKNNHTIGIGTSGYMPEEQEDGYPQFASDIYAVGAIAILCLTGSQPDSLFNRKSRSIEWQHLRQQVNGNFPKVLNKMIAPDYRYRYTDADKALQAIESLISLPISSPVQPVPPSINKRASTLPTKPIQQSIKKPINKPLKNRIFIDEEMQVKIIGICMIICGGAAFIGSSMFIGFVFGNAVGIIHQLFFIITSIFIIFAGVYCVIESSKK